MAHQDAFRAPELIEIADSSLEYDRSEKLPRYATAGISEVRVVDVNRQVIEQYTRPLKGEYTHMQKILAGHAATATTLPASQLTSEQIFGPAQADSL